VDRSAARLAVEHERLELLLEVGLNSVELRSQRGASNREGETVPILLTIGSRQSSTDRRAA
jgi:hypothetical protein